MATVMRHQDPNVSDLKFYVLSRRATSARGDTLYALSENKALNVTSCLLSTCLALIYKSMETHVQIPKDTQDPKSFRFASHGLSGNPSVSKMESAETLFSAGEIKLRSTVLIRQYLVLKWEAAHIVLVDLWEHLQQ